MAEFTSTHKGKLYQSGMSLSTLDYDIDTKTEELANEDLYINVLDGDPSNTLEISLYTQGNPLIQVEPSPAPLEEAEEIETGDSFSFLLPAHKRTQFAQYLREIADMIDDNTMQ